MIGWCVLLVAYLIAADGAAANRMVQIFLSGACFSTAAHQIFDNPHHSKRTKYLAGLVTFLNTCVLGITGEGSISIARGCMLMYRCLTNSCGSALLVHAAKPKLRSNLGVHSPGCHRYYPCRITGGSRAEHIRSSSVQGAKYVGIVNVDINRHVRSYTRTSCFL